MKARRAVAVATIAASAFAGLVAVPGVAQAATGHTASRAQYDERVCLDFAAWESHHSRSRLRRVYEASRGADTYLRVDGGLLWEQPSERTERFVWLDCYTSGD